jgi:hypothetical protein
MCAHAQADQILLRMSACSAGVKFYLFSHCSGTLVKAGFSERRLFSHLFANVQGNGLRVPLFSSLRGHNLLCRLITIEQSKRDFGSSIPKPHSWFSSYSN